MMMDFHGIGRLPAPQDNCAIAIKDLTEGTAVDLDNTRFNLSQNILVGHRFAVQPILKGEPLLSWGMPFGKALRDIAPGEYVCNKKMLNELRSRSLALALPAEANFADDLNLYKFDASHFQPARPLPQTPSSDTFMGIRRPGNRGVGTRNMIVLLAMNALVSGFAQQFENKLKPLATAYDHIDDIVAVTHTEGSQANSNNQELLLRTLTGFMVHPNVGAVLVLDSDHVGVTNEMLQAYAKRHSYPLEMVLHRFMSLQDSFTEDLTRGTAIVTDWLPEVDAMHRTPQPIGELRIALQCGGSDAFSGISGNPLAAWASKAVVQAGGSAVLAETDELIGAESYILEKVRDADTAQRFLRTLARFQERAAWHGHSAEGNPAGGNLYRGLYNIYLKSLGAAAKKHPEVRLDGVLDYGEPIPEAGYYFMDSPGNDLESIAGQVASGCNLIYFVTGNGSVTNFPFVPTIKIVTTSDRYRLLPNEMDINAGAYLEGKSLAELGKEAVDLTRVIASGQHSAGENARHSQVQIWRDWHFTRPVERDQIKVQPSGQPVPISAPVQIIDQPFDAWQTGTDNVGNRIGLILPTSLCSSQIARIAANRLNELETGKAQQISAFVSLPHTEGCGSSIEPEFVNTLIGYMTHPMVVTCLLIEHGCEITHNDFWRQQLRDRGLNLDRFGWASVQLDGGIERVLAKIEAWFVSDCAQLPVPQEITADLSGLQLGLMSDGVVEDESAVSLAILTQQIAAAGGSVILPANDPLKENKAFTTTLPLRSDEGATLPYACQTSQPGFHIMANPSTQWLETMSGLGAAGVNLILALVSDRAQPCHPFIPVLQAASETAVSKPFHADVDLILTDTPQQRLDQLLTKMTVTLSRGRDAKLNQPGNIGFQITRGQLGISL